MGNVPVEATSFVGRRAELAELSGMLGRVRLVTLTGVGGVGKTRLARRAADQAHAAFPDGVWLVELSSLRDPALIGHVILETLPLSDQTTRPVLEVLVEWLTDKQLLLVLDTCEHLIDACTQLVDTLLEAAPGLCVLATSRQVLDLASEREVAVPPLPAGQPQPGTGTAGANDAVVLFAQRAAIAAPGFTLDTGSQETVAGICQRLDGIPLAIELAAARLRELSLDDLAQRLRTRFELLTTQGAGGEAGLGRHRMLRTTIGWSHELCAPLERLLWARLSVFGGGFDAEAVEEVCCGGPLLAGRLPGLLNGLADKSIIVRQEDPDSGLVRYRMLDTVREYGGQWLAELGEHEQTRCRHRDYYLGLAWRGDVAWMGPDQMAWYERTVTEHANFRAALDFSLAGQDGRTALELAGALWFFWLGCGFQREGRHYLEQALGADPQPSPARTRALWACAMVANTQGDPETALRLGTMCREEAQAQGDPGGVRAAAHPIGASLLLRGKPTEAAAVFDQALPAPNRGGYQEAARLMIRALRAIVHTQLEEFAEGTAVARELRAECERRGEQWIGSLADQVRGVAALRWGDAASAAMYARASLEGKRQLHDNHGVALAVDTLASAVAAQGQEERAARLLGLAQQLWQTIGRPQMGEATLRAARQACERRAREAIGDAVYEAAYQMGLQMDPDDGIAYALTTPTAPQ